MSALAVGSTVARVGNDLLVDPEAEEEGQAHQESAMAGLGVMPALGKLSGIWLTGEVDVDAACQVSLYTHCKAESLTSS